jgi:uncharacterized protein YbaP (TraB family)
MNRRRAIALLALVAAAGCHRHEDAAAAPPAAQAPQARHAPAPAAADPWASHSKKDPLAHPLLWAIEKDGHTTYALGTMHMGVDPETRLPDLVWQKLDAAPTFAMETDLSDNSLADLMTKRPDGGTLHHDLGDAYWKKLEAALSPGVAAQMDRMPPTIPVTMLSTRGLPATAPMDGVLLGRAQREHKQIVYLEPAIKQVKLLVKWMDVRALEEILDDLDVTEQMQKDMLDAYVSGDDVKMLALGDQERVLWKKSGRSDTEYDQQMKDMLYDRNASWIDEIEKLHADGGGFIAVGALHLIGKGSVLDLLQHRGYKVTRLTP